MYRFLFFSVLFLSIVCNGVFGLTCQSEDPTGHEECKKYETICATLVEKGKLIGKGCGALSWAQENCGRVHEDGSYCMYCLEDNCNSDPMCGK